MSKGDDSVVNQIFGPITIPITHFEPIFDLFFIIWRKYKFTLKQNLNGKHYLISTDRYIKYEDKN